MATPRFHLLCAVSVAASMALAGCALIQQKPLTPATLELPLAQTDAGIDAVYNTVAKVYLAQAPTMDPALKAKVKPLLQQAYKAVAAADAAELLGDAATLQSQIDAATSLISQAKALLQPS